MDYLDIIAGRYYSTLTGKYYEVLPIGVALAGKDEDHDPRTVGIPFDYEIVDPTEWRYRNLITNLVEKEAATLTIKAKDLLGYRVGSFVVTMDGRLCEITSIVQDTKNSRLEATRIFPIPLATEYVLRLTERENPWGIA